MQVLPSSYHVLSMKRTIHGLILLLPLLIIPASIRAQENKPPEAVAFSGQVRLRSEMDDRHLTANETVFQHLLRSRLRATAKPLSWITVVAEVQDSRYLGSGDPTQARGTTDASADGLDMHQAWAQIDRVFNLPIDLRVGRQEITFANERLVGVSNWSNTGRAFDGARATVRGDGLTVDLWGTRLTAASPGPVESQNFYGIWGNWKPASSVSVDLFGLHDNNTAEVRSGEAAGEHLLSRYTVGTMLRGSFGFLDVELEGAGQLGNTAPNDSSALRDITAFMASANLTGTIDEGTKTRLTLLGTVLSGDGSSRDDRNETFNTLFGTNHKFYGTIDYVPDLSGNFGLVDLSAQIGMSPAKGLRLLLEGHQLLPQRASEEQFGTEVDITVWWRDVVPFELSGGVSVFLPGELLTARIGDEARYWAYIAGQWDF